MISPGKYGQGTYYEPQTIERPGIALIGPSGVGKSTLRNKVCADINDDIRFVKFTPLTTRAQRPGELQRDEYIFVDEAAMARYAISSSYTMFRNGSYGNNYLSPLPEALPTGWYYAYIYLPGAALQLQRRYPNTRIVQVRPNDPGALVERIRQRDPLLDAGELALRAESIDVELREGQGIADATIINDGSIEEVAARLKVVCHDLFEHMPR